MFLAPRIEPYFLCCPTRRPVTTLTELSRVLRKTFINPLWLSGYFMYHHFHHSTILRSAHTVYLCVLYGSQNKQRLFPYTTLTVALLGAFVKLRKATTSFLMLVSLYVALFLCLSVCPQGAIQFPPDGFL